jgi:flagellar M-ring protein FliF
MMLAGAAMLGLMAVLTAVYLTLVRQPYEVLFSNLRTSEAAAIVSVLEEQKVEYQLRDDGRTILAPRGVADSVRLNVGAEELPLKGAVGFELFNKSDMGLTDFAQRINYQRALQGELARTIGGLNAVEAARVHLALAEPSFFREDRKAPKASVSVTPRPGRELLPATVLGIQNLVAAAVPDLAPGDVVVLDQEGTIVSEVVGPAADETAEMQARRGLEAYYAANIRRTLQAAFPGRAVSVRVRINAPAEGSGLLDAAAAGGARTFGMRVSVGLEGMLNEAVDADVRRAVNEAIGFSPALGDVVSVAPAGLPSSAPIAPQAEGLATMTPEAAVDAGPGARAVLLPVLVTLLALLLVAGVTMLVRRRRRPPTGLTELERARLVAQLRRALAEDDDVAAA